MVGPDRREILCIAPDHLDRKFSGAVCNNDAQLIDHLLKP